MAGGAQLVPGLRDLLDAGLLHQVLADPKIVGRRIADAGPGKVTIGDLISLVGAIVIFLDADRLDDVVEWLDQALGVVARYRE